jgi:hypothetical protein
VKLPETVERGFALSQSLYDESRLQLWRLLLSVKRQGQEAKPMPQCLRGAICGKHSTLIQPQPI